MLAEWMDSGKPSVLGGISGAVAGLVAITPASGFVKPMPALLIGFVRRRRLLLHGDARSSRSSATTMRWMRSACTAPAERWARS